MAALYKMFSCQGGLNSIYGECTVKNVLLSRWIDLIRHRYVTNLRTTKTSSTFVDLSGIEPTGPIIDEAVEPSFRSKLFATQNLKELPKIITLKSVVSC